MPGDVLKTQEKPSEPYSEKKYTERGTVMIKSTYEKMKQSGIAFDPGRLKANFPRRKEYIGSVFRNR